MPSTIALSCQHLRCEILPDIGGCIAGLWLGDTPVLRSTPADQLHSARQSGCFPLVPFSNRIGNASLNWAGNLYPLYSTAGDEPHAIHGAGWQRPWRVLDADGASARLCYEHQPDHVWPFAFEAIATFELSASSLELTLSLHNRSAIAVPVGLGWHPYFVKRRHSRMYFDATGRWEMGADKLPTHRSAISGIAADCEALDVDHCFDGWSGVVHLQDELLHTQISSDLHHLVVFTNDSRDFIAIEPVSHVNNALNLMNTSDTTAQALGVRVLQAGASLSVAMRIDVAASGE